ncbi:MAG: hypothetical protein ACNI27_14740 [Desulfovibrio sp.]
MNYKAVLLSALILVLCSGAAFGQSAKAVRGIDSFSSPVVAMQLRHAVERGEMSPLLKNEMMVLLERVESSGLPVVVFEKKISEGLAKKISPKRILTALVALQEQYTTVSQVLYEAGRPTEPITLRNAVAFVQQFSSQALADYLTDFASFSSEGLVTGLVMSVRLGQAGIPLGFSNKILLSAPADGLGYDWRGLVQVVTSLTARGVPLSEILKKSIENARDNGGVRGVMDAFSFTPRNVLQEK